MKISASVKLAAALALVAAPVAAKQTGVDLDPSITGAAPAAPRAGTKVGYFVPKGTTGLPVRDPYAKQAPVEPSSEEARPSSEILVETFKLSERVFPDMPTPRFNAAAVASGPGFYVMGGESGGKVLNSFEFYDPGLAKWTTLDPMPTARTMLAAAVVGNAIYAIGGSDKKKSLSVVEVYDIQKGKWSRKRDMLHSRHRLAAAVSGGKLYAIGGQEGEGAPLDLVEAYDPDSGQWEDLAQMTNPRVSPGVTVINDEIWVIGGASQRDGRLQAIPDVEVFDPTKLGWISAVPLNEAKFGVTPILINGQIWSVGGYDGTGKSSMQTEFFSFRDHQWSFQHFRLKSIPGAAAGAQIPSIVFSFGGRDAAGRALSVGQMFDTHSGILEQSHAPKTEEPKKPAAEPAPIPQEKAHFEPGAPVARPPAPQGVDPKNQVIYGVAFDLETLKPAADATIVLLSLPTRVGVQVKTDARGWYRYAFRKGDLPDVDFAVVSDVYKTEPLRERNPALASLSPEVRQFYANDSPADASPRTRIAAAAPFVEVDLALVPKLWSSNAAPSKPQVLAAPAKSREVVDPPAPARPSDSTHCYVYGLFYDALTGKSFPNAHLMVSADSPNERRYAGQFAPNELGYFKMDLVLSDMGRGLWVTAQVAGQDAGISADTDPPLRKRPESERRQAANRLEFERARLPDDEVCAAGVVRFDLVAIPPKAP